MDFPETFREIGEALDVKPYDRITFGQRADMTELVTITDLVIKPWELIRPDDCKPIRFKRKVSGQSRSNTSASRVFSLLVIFSPISLYPHFSFCFYPAHK